MVVRALFVRDVRLIGGQNCTFCGFGRINRVDPPYGFSSECTSRVDIKTTFYPAHYDGITHFFLSRLQHIQSRTQAWATTPAARRLMKRVRFVAAAGIIGYLVYSLSGMGWGNLIRDMPRTPWFYALVVVMYFLLPIFETVAYRFFIPARRTALLSVFIRKKVLNMDLMGYSGEVFFLFWVKEKLGIARSKMLRVMIDMGITSSMGGFTASGLLLALLLFLDVLPLDLLVGDTDRTLLLGGLLVAAVMVVAGYQFRHTIFKLPGRTILALYGAHVGRFMVNWVLQILQWWVVLPDVSFIVWGTMLAIWTVTNRLPFIVTRDLVAIALILELPAELLGGVETAIASMLLTRVAADRLLGLSLFLPLSLVADSRNARVDGLDTALRAEAIEYEEKGAHDG